MPADSTSMVASSPGSSDVFADACVVIVDDEPVNTVLLDRLLRSVGISDVHTVTDPGDAAARCLAVGADLVLLDLHMSGMDGHQVLEQLRASLPDGEFLPVVVVTADTTVEARDRALQAGANDFLTKPLDHTEALLRVRNLLETRALYTELLASRDQHRHRQRMVLEVATQVTGDLDVTDLANSIVEGVTAVTEFGAAVLTVRDGDDFERVAASGVDEPRIGLRTHASQWHALLQEDYRHGALTYLIPPDRAVGDGWMQTVETPRPVRRPRGDRDVWTPEHGLVLALLDHTGAWAGFLSVDAPSTGLLPDDETLQLLELFAWQAQAGLSNARLFDLVRRQREVSDALRAAGDALASSLDLKETLKRCCDAVVAHSVGDRATIYLHDAGSDQYRAVMTRGGEPDADLWRAFKELPPVAAEQVPIFADVMRTGEPVLVSQVTTAHVRRRELELFSLKSLAAYPLQLDDRTVGILVVDSYTRHVRFPDDEVDLVRRMASQTAVAIRQAQLHGEARRHANRVWALHELTKELTRTFDVATIFDRITEAIPGYGAALVEVGEEHARVLQSSHRPEGGQRGLPYDIPRDALPPEFWERLTGDGHLSIPDVCGTSLEALAPPGVCSLLAASHQDADGRQLALALTSERREAFDADDAVFVEGLVEIAALAQRNARLFAEATHAAERDALTGLKNRRMYRAELTALLAGTSPDAPVAMGFLDIDDFKAINDRHGHDVGDQVLVHVADRLRRSVREDDEVYRIGGEEFVVVMPDAGPSDAATVAERIRSNVATTRKDLPATSVSVGVAVGPDHGTDIDALFRAADRALYEAKAAGKDTVRVADR